MPSRVSATVLSCLAAYGALGFAINGLGSLLVPLQHETGMSRGSVALFPTMFAASFLVVGVFGLLRPGRLGHESSLRIVGLVMAAALLSVLAPWTPVIVLGVALLGLANGAIVVAVPAVLAREFANGGRRELNAVNVLGGVLGITAPLLVSASLVAHLGWRVGYCAPLALLDVLLLATARARPEAADEGPRPDIRLTRSAAWTWLGLVLAVAVEFGFIFWSADAIATWTGLSRNVAASAPMLFVGGMAVGRAAAAALDRRATAVLVVCFVLLLGGALTFMWSDNPWLAGVALSVAGLGLGPWYPAMLSSLIRQMDVPQTGSSWGAVASGIAIIASPQLLGHLADATDLGTAFWAVPVLVVLLAVNFLVSKVVWRAA